MKTRHLFSILYLLLLFYIWWSH